VLLHTTQPKDRPRRLKSFAVRAQRQRAWPPKFADSDIYIQPGGTFPFRFRGPARFFASAQGLGRSRTRRPVAKLFFDALSSGQARGSPIPGRMAGEMPATKWHLS